MLEVVRGVKGALKVIVNSSIYFSAPPHKAISDCAPIKGGTPAPIKQSQTAPPKHGAGKDGDANKLAIWGRSRWSLDGDADLWSAIWGALKGFGCRNSEGGRGAGELRASNG